MTNVMPRIGDSRITSHGLEVVDPSSDVLTHFLLILKDDAWVFELLAPLDSVP
jgi:hypothetical protein